MHSDEPGPTHSWLHDVMHAIADLIGHDVGDHLPGWMHFVLHIVLIWGPVLMLLVLAFTGWRSLRRRGILRRRRATRPRPLSLPGLPQGIYRFVILYSRPAQIVLIAGGLVAMPVLYATFELPKVIINSAIDGKIFPKTVLGIRLSQTDYLFVLSALYLLAVLTSGALKFCINVYKGRVGERLLRRLRLTIYRHWWNGRGTEQRTQVIPIIAQEVEPVGGFASDAFALPVFQGGTFITILVFMFMQDPVLGAAAVTLLPIQIWLIPRLQRRVNRLSRKRVAEVRAMSGELGAQASDRGGHAAIGQIGSSLRRIEIIRRRIHRTKFFMKALNNFLTSLTPFFFYSIGGYLVIEGRLSLGALVAVLAAYKDFSAPLRELFRYYQRAEDVRIRYDEMLRFLGTAPPATLDPGAQDRPDQETAAALADADTPSTQKKMEAQQ